MIYLTKITKKKKIEKRFTMTCEDAKHYLFGLKKNDFAGSDILVIGAEPYLEFEEIKAFFSDSYLVPSNNGIIDILTANPLIPKSGRLRNRKASLIAIKKFVQKIMSKTDTRQSEIKLHLNNVVIYLYGDELSFCLVCNYELDIIKIEILDKQRLPITSLEHIDNLKKNINKILVKQRHYYKRIKK
jgi:hypothetical protein